MMRARNRLTRTTGLGLAVATALALGAGPLLAECTNRDGSSRECTPSEQYYQCMDRADDAHAQCRAGQRTTGGRIACRAFWGFDAAGCSASLYKNVFFSS